MSENENPTAKSFRRPTAVAGTVIGMGLVASVAGNFQSIILEPGSPSIGAMISAVWWPALLFAMIELAIHTPWGNTALWRTIQWLGAGVIGGLAFYISYFHLAHVLSYFGYDVVSRYAGPITVDVAMMVATLAMNRVGVAKALAKAEMAKELANEELATATVASPDEVAAADLANDWANLEDEVASYVAAEKARPVSAPPAAAAPAEEPASAPAPAPRSSALTTVPAEAAKRIQEILDATPDATGVTIAQALMAAGLASSEKTGRRWAGAVKNGTARVA